MPATTNTASTSIVSTPTKKSPFIDALASTRFGQMTLTTPDGKVHQFTGSKPGYAADWHVYDWGVFDDFIARGELGFADAYMDGRWDSNDLVALTGFGLMNADQLEKFFYGKPLYAIWVKIKNILFSNSPTRSQSNVERHYDLGNDFYRLWLDDSMTYSCALFEGDASKPLKDAQQAKYARILNKLNAKPGDHILEIGCGWGGFAEVAAKKGLRVTAITLASTQAEFARERMKKAGLDQLVDIQLIDYRKVQGAFDHIVSIGMFEHVGEKYWTAYFDTVRQRLKPGGKAIVQTITLDDDAFEHLGSARGFIEEYIFPGGMLPSKKRFRQATQEAGMQCHELYSFGGDYAITLSKWLDRFNEKIDAVRAQGFDERFIRLWRLYLTSCIASFQTKRSDVMQAEITHAAQSATTPLEQTFKAAA